MPPVGAYVLVGAIAAGCTFLLTFVVRRQARRIGFVATPDERRVHSNVTPYGGGVAMFVAFLVAMIVASQLPARFGLRSLFQGSSEPLGLVLGAAVIFGVGLIDDIRDMSAPAKMAGQILAATVLVYFGVTMFQFKIPLAGLVVLSDPNWLTLITAIWVIVITNAVNLIDGLDGLAAGIVAIASGALAVYGIQLVRQGALPSDNIGPLIAVIACGVCVGFLPHNFHPARIFMGDTGALFLGLLMAAATMVIGGRSTAVSGQTYFFFAPLFLPVFILGVPIADMAFAFVRRTAKRQGFDTPDKDHIHHRLLRLGHGHRRTVVILWAWTALLSGFVLVPLFGWNTNAVVPFGAGVLVLLLYTFFHPGLRKHMEDLDGPVSAVAAVPDVAAPEAPAEMPASEGAGPAAPGSDGRGIPALGGAVPVPRPEAIPREPNPQQPARLGSSAEPVDPGPAEPEPVRPGPAVTGVTPQRTDRAASR